MKDRTNDDSRRYPNGTVCYARRGSIADSVISGVRKIRLCHLRAGRVGGAVVSGVYLSTKRQSSSV